MNNFIPESQDIALDAFRAAFPLVTSKVKVSKDGMTMTYAMVGSRLLDQYLATARLVILMHGLPLTADREIRVIGDMVYEENLVVSFEPALTELECY